MKKLLVILLSLAFFLIAVPVQADWVNDLPIPKGVTYIGVEYQGDVGIITIGTKSGSCMEYKIVNDEIVSERKCNDVVWRDFVKK